MTDATLGSEWRPLLSGQLKSQAVERILSIASDLRVIALQPSSPPMDPSLARGYAGLAILYHYLAEEFPRESFGKDCSACLERAADGISELSHLPYLYGGYPGVAWAIRHLQNRGFHPAMEYDLSEIDDAVSTAVSDGSVAHYDLISGLVGLGVYLLEDASRASSDALDAIVRALLLRGVRTPAGLTWFTSSDLLPAVQRQEGVAGIFNFGLSHGVPGIIALFGNVMMRGSSVPLRDRLNEIIDWLHAGRDLNCAKSSFPCQISDSGAWVDGRAAWCYGDPGVGVALVAAGHAASNQPWVDSGRLSLELAASLNPEDSGVQDACLCHGSSGLAHIFARGYHALGSDRLREGALFWYRDTIERHREGAGIGGYLYNGVRDRKRVSTPSAGLLEGSAGIALALLAGISEVEPSWDISLLTNIRPFDP